VGFDVIRAGRRSYEAGYALQLEVHGRVMSGEAGDTLILIEHDPVITLGAGYHAENLLASPEALSAMGIAVATTDRGGDVTYHGPGQLVAYPIFRLEERDLHAYLRRLEEAVIVTLREFGLAGERNPVNTGVWLGNRKVCAIGIKVRRWVTLHGLALNCNIDLDPFGTIVPCGIRGNFGVTSMSLERGHEVTIDEVSPVLVKAFEQVFG
jgi:lipoyl(octanoyl) transferase